MAQKTTAREKGTKGKKAAAPAKAATKKRAGKGESLECQVCGLSVVVEEVGDIAIARESALLCCGKPMTTKAAKKAKK